MRHTLSLCLAAAFAANIAVAQAPSNDDPVNAIPVFDGINPGAPTGLSGFTFSNVGATTTAGYVTACGSNASFDVWFLYTANVTGFHAISNCTPGDFAQVTLVDSILSVYDIAAPTTSIGCDDDGCNTLGSIGATTSYLSHLSVNLTAGTSYYIRVSSWTPTTATGTFHLNILPPVALGDTCATATPMVPGWNYVAMTGLTASGAITPNCAATSGTVTQFLATSVDGWAAYTASSNSIVSIWREGSTAPRLGVFTGACGAEVAVSATNTCTSSQLVNTSFVASAGTTYLFRIGNTTATTTANSMHIAEFPIAANDECAGAFAVALGTNGPFTNGGTTTSASIPSCMTTTTAFNDAWYAWTAPLTATVKMNTCNSSSDPWIAVYDACGGLQVACDDDDAANAGPCATTQTLNSFVQFNAVAGTTYLVRVGNNTTAAMTYFLNIEYVFSFTMTYDPVNFTVALADVAGTPGDFALNAITLTQGAYPNGWFYGVDLSIFELTNLITSGPPFFVLLDGFGGFSLTIPGIPPLGLTFYGVGVEFSPAGLFVRKSAPTSVTI
jgi:hypothetical protein